MVKTVIIIFSLFYSSLAFSQQHRIDVKEITGRYHDLNSVNEYYFNIYLAAYDTEETVMSRLLYMEVPKYYGSKKIALLGPYKVKRKDTLKQTELDKQNHTALIFNEDEVSRFKARISEKKEVPIDNLRIVVLVSMREKDPGFDDVVSLISMEMPLYRNSDFEINSPIMHGLLDENVAKLSMEWSKY